MRPEASLILTGTLFASGMMFMVAGPGQTLEWGELGTRAGVAGAVLSLPFYARRLAGPGGPAVPLFWKGIALLILFGFWFGAALALNTAWSWGRPERIEGVVDGKRISEGRHGDMHYVRIATSRATVETDMPRDVWLEVAEGRRLEVLICRGALGYPYVVTPLDRGPYLDIPSLLGLRADDGGALRC